MTDKRLKPQRGRPILESRRELVKQLYLSGLGLRDVAREVGSTFQAVHAMLKRMDVPMRRAGGNMGGHSRHRK
jgi:DNA invertase Pin-like site-specific DNA recombinase